MMKINVGVFFGGNSVEHEISIISALQAMGAMDSERYNVVPVYITRENRFYTGQALREISNFKDLKGLLAQCQQVVPVKGDGQVELYQYPFSMFHRKRLDYIDVSFPIVHGTNVEDGALQGFLQYLGAPMVGCDVLSSAVGMDKYVMKVVLKDKGIPVLDGLQVDSFAYEEREEATLDEIEARFAYPVIVKPVNLGSSVGIRIAADRDALRENMKYAFSYAKGVLVEHAIENLREINCSVLGDMEHARASECEEPFNTDEILSYEDKYVSSGGSKGMAGVQRQLPADIPDSLKTEIQEIAVRTFQALRCNGVVRIDFMLDGDTGKVYVNEINTIPGSLAFYLWKAGGMEYKELLTELIQLAFKRARDMKDISYRYDTNILSSFSFGGTKGGKL